MLFIKKQLLLYSPMTVVIELIEVFYKNIFSFKDKNCFDDNISMINTGMKKRKSEIKIEDRTINPIF